MGGAGSRDFMQSCATGRPGEQFETGVDKRPEPQPPITATTVSKLYSPACATVQPVMVKASEKVAPLCLPEVDSPIENSDSSPLADTK
ncbi:unnamed protein product [Dibothriocephalus latus]|uniref:Uncharacterized protein n=1 Tax=Dibothriocephalus latus TaxID=60516 RepID=A0A3P7LH97_DIBLA|nr:unnamed protein product [Dibothriocephalus latus]